MFFTVNSSNCEVNLPNFDEFTTKFDANFDQLKKSVYLNELLLNFDELFFR